MTQNFYAANTQIMEGDESAVNHSNNAGNLSGTQFSIFDDIHEMATQEARFNIFINKSKSTEEPNSKKDQGIPNMSKNAKINIHDAQTQVLNFNNISNTENTCDAPTKVVHFNNISNTENIPEAPTQVVHFDDISNTENIHDAPTQVVHFDNIINTGNIDDVVTQVVHYDDTSNNTEINIHEAPTQVVQYPEQKSIYPKHSNKISFQHLHSNSSKSGSQESCDTIIINLSGVSKLENKVTENSSLISSPGPSVSQVNKTFDDDSILNNSKNVSGLQRTEIEESVIEETITDGNSNDSVDFLTMQVPAVFDEIDNEEKVEALNNKCSQPESIHPKNGSLPLDSDLESNKRFSQDSTQSSVIGKVQKLRKLSSSTELEESDSDSETTQDIFNVKKPLKKLPTDSDSENDSIHEVESLKNFDCQNEFINLKNGLGTEDGLHKVSVKTSETDDTKKSSQDKKNQNLEVTQSSDSDTDCEEHLDEFERKGTGKSIYNPNENFRKASQEDLGLNNEILQSSNSQSSCKNEASKVSDTEDKSKPSSSKMNSVDTSDQKNNKEEKLNDSDYIPATQDAFADAFSYRSEAGKSSSTEDFRLGLTQLMEDSLNDGSLKSLEQNEHINNENNSRITISQQVSGFFPDLLSFKVCIYLNIQQFFHCDIIVDSYGNIVKCQN